VYIILQALKTGSNPQKIMFPFPLGNSGRIQVMIMGLSPPGKVIPFILLNSGNMRHHIIAQ
jgi:hypothetical protein